MLPQGFPERMLHLLGEAEFAEFLASYERPRSAGLRLNPRKPLPDGASLPFCEAQVPWEPNGYYVCEGSRPGLHPWHDAGAYYLQEPSAMAPARLLDAQPGERVLDLCAAPGGKTTRCRGQQGRGLLVCNEIHPRRAQVLASNIERLGIPNALVLSEHPAKLAQRFPGYFDRILVDAPWLRRGHVPEGGGRRDGLERGDRGHVRRAAAGDSRLRSRNAGPRRAARLFHLHVLARGK